MNEQKTKKTCPVWVGYGLNTRMRKLIHNPNKLVGKYIKPGMKVADIGTGMGFMTLPMAEMVGDHGKVIAVDIQEKMLSKVIRAAEY